MTFTHILRRELILSSRLQKIHNDYNRKQIEIENNEKILKDVMSSLNAIKASLSEDTISIINSYQPGLLELLNFDTIVVKDDLVKTKENINRLKDNIKYVLETLLTNMERELL